MIKYLWKYKPLYLTMLLDSEIKNYYFSERDNNSMDEIEKSILEILFKNNEIIAKDEGWNEHKIFRVNDILRVDKGKSKAALFALKDIGLIFKKTTSYIIGGYGKHPSTKAKDAKYRINQKGIETLQKEAEEMSKSGNIKISVDPDITRCVYVLQGNDEKEKFK